MNPRHKETLRKLHFPCHVIEQEGSNVLDRAGRIFCICEWFSPIAPDTEERKRLHAEHIEYVLNDYEWAYGDPAKAQQGYAEIRKAAASPGYNELLAACEAFLSPHGWEGSVLGAQMRAALAATRK